MTKDEYEDFALRYKGCGACFPMYHTLSRFEKMWFSAIQKDVAELEKENAELKADNDARKFAMAMSEKVEKQLREENSKLKEALEGYKKIAKWCDKCDKIAELKSENQRWKDEWQEQVQKATDEGYARTLQTIQLTTAIEIIKDLLSLCEGETDSKLVFTRAEQFLKENSTYERIQKAKYNYID